MRDKQRKSGFIMIWPEELSEVKKIGASAFILRQVYRLHKDRETSICSLSDLSIERIIGWEHKRTTRARNKLLSCGLIERVGYHRYYIPNHDIYKTSGETPELKGKTSGETPEPIRAKRPNTSGETPEQLGHYAPVHNNIDRKDVVDSKATTLSPILKDDLKALFIAQGQQGEPLLVFFYTVAQERLNKGYKEGLLRVAIKRAISANSKATIQDILSYETLSGIKADQDRIKKQAEDELKRKEDEKNRCTPEEAAAGIKALKSAVDGKNFLSSE